MAVSANLIVNAKYDVRKIRTLLEEGLKYQIHTIDFREDHSVITLTHRGQQSRLCVIMSTEYGGLDATIISTNSRYVNTELLREMAKVLGGFFQEGDTDSQFEMFQEPHNGNARFILDHQILATANDGPGTLSDMVALATGYEKPRQDLYSVMPDVFPKFTAKPSPHVKGEFEVYKNGSIFCHLSESDFETFKKGFDYKIEIVAERGVYDTI